MSVRSSVGPSVRKSVRKSVPFYFPTTKIVFEGQKSSNDIKNDDHKKVTSDVARSNCSLTEKLVSANSRRVETGRGRF